MDKMMRKAQETGKQAAQKLKALPEQTKQAVKDLPDKSKALAQKTVKAATQMQRRTRLKLIVAVVAFVLVILIAGGIIGGRHLWYAKKNRAGLEPFGSEDITRSSAVPYIKTTLNDNGLNGEVVSYLEQDPYLVNIYEGYGFAKDYGSARGHNYTLEDVHKTLRPHALANCLTCKSADFTRLVNEEGVGVYTRDFEEVYQSLNLGISCYTCHGEEDPTREGNNLTVTHSYITKGLGENMSAIDPAILACGQCHIEYYFTPENKETMIPYSSVETMTPEAILAYYNEIGFSDWVQPSTGAQMLKAQHPEMETVMQGKHAGMLSCADCHMPIEQSYDGAIYHSHTLVSPLKNETLLASCAKCHEDTDMVNMVEGIQRRVTARETQVGNALSAFKDALASAVEKGETDEDTLSSARTLYREAQWFFDYCYVENSEGAHNSDLAFHCLDVAEQKINEGMAILSNEMTDDNI